MSVMISGMGFNAAQSPVTAGNTEAAPETRRTEVPARSQRPVVDQYVPEEKRETPGLYWLGKDENGQPKVFFDDPERPADEPSDDPAPSKRPDKAERCTANTDQVDREIRRLKERKETLERHINAQTDAAKIKELERKLSQVERELASKDNDTYRRQHTVFS